MTTDWYIIELIREGFVRCHSLDRAVGHGVFGQKRKCQLQFYEQAPFFDILTLRSKKSTQLASLFDKERTINKVALTMG